MQYFLTLFFFLFLKKEIDDDHSLLSASVTTDDMPESYLVSTDGSVSFLGDSSSSELNDSMYQVESILLEEDAT